MTESYEYPGVLYCGQCRQDVDTKIVERTAVYVHQRTGEEIAVSYKAAVCPVCGSTLCERDQTRAFVRMTLKQEEDRE